MTETKWLPSTRFSEIHTQLLKGGQKQFQSRLQKLADRLVTEKEKEEKKDFRQILADELNAEEEERLAMAEDEVEEEGEPGDIEDEAYPPREATTRGERQVDGVGEDLDTDELVGEYAHLGEDDELRATREGIEAAKKRKALIAAKKKEKSEMAKKRKRLGVSSVKDMEEDIEDEIDEMNEAIEEGTDYDEESGPLPLTKDNILDTIGAIDPRLGVAVAGIRGIEDAINHPGSTADKIAAFGKTLGYGAVNSVLGMVGIQMSPEQWNDATNKIAYGFEKVFAPGNAAAKEERWAREEAQRQAESTIQNARKETQYKKFETTAKATNEDAMKFEELVDAVDGGYASAQQQSEYNRITSQWDAITNGTHQEAVNAYIQLAQNMKSTKEVERNYLGEAAKNVASAENAKGNNAITTRQEGIGNSNAMSGVAGVGFGVAKKWTPSFGIGPEQQGLLRTSCSIAPKEVYDKSGRLVKYECATDEMAYTDPRARNQVSYSYDNTHPEDQIPEGAGLPTLAPDGKGVYLTPYSNPFNGDFAWNAIYTEEEGIIPMYEGWFFFAVGQENTPAQKRARLMRKLGFKTTPAFTAWLNNWNWKIQVAPLPENGGDFKNNYGWNEFIPENYPVLPFSQQYKAYSEAMARWEAIINQQLKWAIEYQQVGELVKAGIVPDQLQGDEASGYFKIGNADFNQVIQNRSDSPDTRLNTAQEWWTRRLIAEGPYQAPPAPIGLIDYLWQFTAISPPIYTDPDTGIAISAYNPDGTMKTQDQIQREMGDLKTKVTNEEARLRQEEADKKAEEERKAAEAQRRQEAITKAGETYTKTIADKESKIQSNATLREEFNFIKSINDLYKTADGFAKRHWFDIQAAKSGGVPLLYRKAEWDDLEPPSYLFAPFGQSFKDSLQSVINQYWGSQTQDPNNPRSVPYRQKKYASLMAIPEDDDAALRKWVADDFAETAKTNNWTQQQIDYYTSQGMATTPTRTSDGKADKGQIVEQEFPTNGNLGNIREPLKQWQFLGARDIGSPFEYVEPPSVEQLMNDGLDKKFNDRMNTYWNDYLKGRKQVASYYTKVGETTLQDRNGITYKVSEIPFSEASQADKDAMVSYGYNKLDIKPDEPFLRLVPGGSEKKMEETEEYKRLQNVFNEYAQYNELIRRFKAEDWGEDKDAKISDMNFLQTSNIDVEGVTDYKLTPKPGYYIPLMTFVEFNQYYTELKADKAAKWNDGTPVSGTYVWDAYMDYITMKLDQLGGSRPDGLGFGLQDIDYRGELDKMSNVQNEQGQYRPNPEAQNRLAGNEEVRYRIKYIQYPKAYSLVKAAELKNGSTPAPAETTPEVPPSGSGRPHPALLAYTSFSKGKSKTSRPKKQLSAEHLAKLQAGRKKYQAEQARQRRLY